MILDYDQTWAVMKHLDLPKRSFFTTVLVFTQNQSRPPSDIEGFVH